MPGFRPGIHEFGAAGKNSWIPGPSPGMTTQLVVACVSCFQPSCRYLAGLPISGAGEAQGVSVAEKCQILGWVLFIVSACAFIASSLRSGDMLGLIGGVFFLVACFVFLIPYGMARPRD